jgi:hypothetical protein
VYLEDGFAVAEFGTDLVIPAKSIPDKKSGDKNEDGREDDEDNCEWRESSGERVRHVNLLCSRQIEDVSLGLKFNAASQFPGRAGLRRRG